MAAIGFMTSGNTEDFSGAAVPERVYLINNTFVGGSYGVVGGANFIVFNNIFKDFQNSALRRVNVDSIASYNLFWNNGIDYEESNVVIDYPDPDVPPTNIVLADPLLDLDYSLTRPACHQCWDGAFRCWREILEYGRLHVSARFGCIMNILRPSSIDLVRFMR
jgi:hypothetical protein